jgi:hypothetical protein
MDIKDIFIPGIFVPNKLIFKNEIHKILDLEKKFVIRGYTIKIVDGKIDMVNIKNPHPNANPKTGEFCIPNGLRKHELDDKTKNIIEIMLCCFNLDDCYFTPWNEIKYEKQEV